MILDRFKIQNKVAVITGGTRGIGLAIAHALSCIAEYIQRWKEIKHYWVWWFWAIWLLMLSVGFWISIYAFYSKIETWEGKLHQSVVISL